jgi:hypothetical protein
MHKNIGILFTSRNNYEMLDDWMEKVNTTGFSVLNIDEDSTVENKKLGKELCKKHKIGYMDREERGMQFNISTAGNYFKKDGVDWILWFQHDSYPKTEDFFNRLNDYLDNHDLTKFGAIGFNILHDWHDIKDWNGDDTPLRVTARTPLEPGDMYYRHYEYWPKTRVRYDNRFNKPFAVESIMWAVALVNINQYEKYIEPTSDYHFFHAWDDICFQFLYNNIYNIVLPQFCLAHEQEIKVKFGLPKSSPKGDVDIRNHFYSKWGHLEVWKERWGFEYGDRDTFEAVKSHYEKTLLQDFYYHDPINGPLRSFNL